MSKYRVYDDRTDETLWEGTEMECITFLHNHFPLNSKDFPNVWIEPTNNINNTNHPDSSL